MNDEIRPVVATLELVAAMEDAPGVIHARRLVRSYDSATVRRALAVVEAFERRGELIDLVAEVVDTEEDAVRAPLPVNGRDLIAAGIKPGPGMGQALARVLDAFLANPALTNAEAIAIAKAA